MDRLESWIKCAPPHGCTMHGQDPCNFQTFASPFQPKLLPRNKVPGMALVLLALALAAKPTLYDMKAFTTDGHLMDLAEVSVIHHT
jgi:hypothetical protein